MGCAWRRGRDDRLSIPRDPGGCRGGQGQDARLPDLSRRRRNRPAAVGGIGRLPSAPNLAGQNEGYLAKQLRDYRSGKRTHQFMRIVAKDLSDADIDDLAAWYASIKITVTLPD